MRSHGALTSEAYEALEASAVERMYTSLKAVMLEAGGMMYVGEGLLTQYALAERTQPSIIRFIQKGQVMFIPYEASTIYVKTINRSVLYYWDEYTLRQLLGSYPELLKIYMQLRDAQEAMLDFKVRLLEEKVRDKLVLFKKYYRDLLPNIKNQDLANFFHVNESTLSRGKQNSDF